MISIWNEVPVAGLIVLSEKSFPSLPFSKATRLLNIVVVVSAKIFTYVPILPHRTISFVVV